MIYIVKHKNEKLEKRINELAEENKNYLLKKKN
jgi:hypothetical protein